MLSDFYKPLQKMEVNRVSDNRGGFVTTYINPVDFQGRLSRMSDSEILVAAQMGTKATYLLFCAKTFALAKNDVIFDFVKYYRLTDNHLDDPPAMSAIKERQYKAEQLEVLP